MSTTQVEALESIQGYAPTLRERVRNLYLEYGAMTDEDLWDIYLGVYRVDIQRGSLIARRNELGAQDTGETKRNRSGRRAIVWDLV